MKKMKKDRNQLDQWISWKIKKLESEDPSRDNDQNVAIAYSMAEKQGLYKPKKKKD